MRLIPICLISLLYYGVYNLPIENKASILLWMYAGNTASGFLVIVASAEIYQTVCPKLHSYLGDGGQ
jgi:hypothetical protein